MNKTELVKKVAAENELSQKQAAAVVDSVLNAVVDTVAAGEPVALLGFGTFSVKHRDARQGRNPAEGHEQKDSNRAICDGNLKTRRKRQKDLHFLLGTFHTASTGECSAEISKAGCVR